jgi:hypothetical protein
MRQRTMEAWRRERWAVNDGSEAMGMGMVVAATV